MSFPAAGEWERIAPAVLECAEVAVRNMGSTARCAPTEAPTAMPTIAVTTKRPTRRPTAKPTFKPKILTVAPTVMPSESPLEVRPYATCDEICLVPIETRDCALVSFDNLPQCLDVNGKTINVGDVCEGSGECNTSED